MLSVDSQDEEILEKFILQNYLATETTNNEIIEILTTLELRNAAHISKIINIKLVNAKNGDKLAWQKLAQNSAEESLTSRVMEYRKQKINFQNLANLIGRSKSINRIVCFDISHTTGKEAVAACVVFNAFGKEQTSYRLFNIKTPPGDDYAALAQAIYRYLEGVISKTNQAPDIIMVDGGKGQLGVAEKVLSDFNARLDKNMVINLLAIAKGKERKVGLEKIYLQSNGLELSLQATSQVFKLLQKIRDAAHRFAITSHRKKRDKLIRKIL